MNVILSILVIAVVIAVFFVLCAFALQAATAELPKYEVPPTTYSYNIDGQHGDTVRCVARPTSASGESPRHIWVIDVNNGRMAFCADENPGRQDGEPPLEPR